MIGVTLGTGFGSGIVINGRMLVGDNSAGGEIWLMRNKINNSINAEEGVTIRAVRKQYSDLTGTSIDEVPSPLEISRIAGGDIRGDKEAALESFRSLGEVLGDALANTLTLIDGAVVIGGGLSGASNYFLPAVMSELNGSINGFPRIESTVFNLEDGVDSELFYRIESEQATHPIYEKSFKYEKTKKIPLGISRLGTSSSVALGAYFFAMGHFDKEKI